MVALVYIAGDQVGAVRIGARQQNRRHIADVGGETRRDEMADSGRGRHEHLPAHMPALLLRGKLILEVDTSGARLDHRLHQLEDIQRAAKASLGVGHDRREPVGLAVPLGMVDLVGALQRLVDALDNGRHAIRRIEALIRIHLAREVSVRGHLPATEVDRLQARLDLLHRLIARQRAQRRDIRLRVEEIPEAVRAQSRQGMLDDDGTTQTHHIFRAIGTSDTLPTGIFLPAFRQSSGVLLGVRTRIIR